MVNFRPLSRTKCDTSLKQFNTIMKPNENKQKSDGQFKMYALNILRVLFPFSFFMSTFVVHIIVVLMLDFGLILFSKSFESSYGHQRAFLSSVWCFGQTLIHLLVRIKLPRNKADRLISFDFFFNFYLKV